MATWEQLLRGTYFHNQHSHLTHPVADQLGIGERTAVDLPYNSWNLLSNRQPDWPVMSAAAFALIVDLRHTPAQLNCREAIIGREQLALFGMNCTKWKSSRVPRFHVVQPPHHLLERPNGTGKWDANIVYSIHWLLYCHYLSAIVSACLWQWSAHSSVWGCFQVVVSNRFITQEPPKPVANYYYPTSGTIPEESTEVSTRLAFDPTTDRKYWNGQIVRLIRYSVSTE